MAKPNYQFEKRQRDLAKLKKQEEKRRQKLADKAVVEGGGEASQTNSEGVVMDSAKDEGDCNLRGLVG